MTAAAPQDWSTALLDAGLVDDLSLHRARRAAEQGGTRLDAALLELGLLDEDRLIRFFCDLRGLKMADPADFDPEPIPELAAHAAFLNRALVAPVALRGGTLIVASSDPLDHQLAATLRFQFDMPVELRLSKRRTIQDALARTYPDAEADTGIETVSDEDLERLRSLANEGPVIKLVTDLIAGAVEQGASDIHVEAQETELQVRYRVDGSLHQSRTIGADQRAAVVSRLKVMANLNISERRRPQDGRIRTAVRGRNIDLRLSTIPTQFGESIVLRVLDQSALNLDWATLGFGADMIAQIERLTALPHGLFLVCGPTGSGKTTTLYTALSKLDHRTRKIFTVEDPIEYTLPGINQVQVRPDLDLTFATALRAILRQDPNVVLLGEIRDEETAEAAIRAALMGRMVLSTVHTNSAIGAVDRLTDLGVPRFLLAATLRGVLSQRLLGRPCPGCTRPAGIEVPGHQGQFVTADGCATCNQTGTRGRGVVAELFVSDAEIEAAIARGAQAAELEEMATERGMVGIGEAAIRCAGKSDGLINEALAMQG
ncbi:MAG: GspE/PulE family protein [Pseudomonadota bacterium]